MDTTPPSAVRGGTNSNTALRVGSWGGGEEDAAPGWAVLKDCLTVGAHAQGSALIRGVLSLLHRGQA